MPTSALRICLFLVLLLGIVAVLRAAEPQLVERFRSWDAYVFEPESGERLCYALSVPTEMQPEGLNRGASFVLVSHRPNDGVRGEISIIAGYPYEPDSEVEVQIGRRNFRLFVNGDSAWHYDRDEEARMVRAMRSGVAMRVVGQSSRGNETTDTYSLLGFTRALERVNSGCNDES